MKREEFEALVESQAGPDLQGSDYLKAAIYDFAKLGGPFYQFSVQAVLKDAGERREQADMSQESTASRQAPRPKPGAEAHFVSRKLVEGLKSWTEGLRQESEFGSVDTPFPGDVGAAAKYIEETFAADLARWNENRDDRKEDYERIDQLAHRLGLDVSPRMRSLPYQRPDDDHQKSAPVAPGTFLFKLAGEVNRISRSTGLPPDALTEHVFTGITPLMSRVRITNRENHTRLPSGEQAHSRSVTLTFRTADLTFEELRTIYEQVKSHMGGKGIQALTTEDFELWELVQLEGGPPEPYQGVREFWRNLLKEWNRKHPNDTPLKSWEGLQKRHRRICKRLGTQ